VSRDYMGSAYAEALSHRAFVFTFIDSWSCQPVAFSWILRSMRAEIDRNMQSNSI